MEKTWGKLCPLPGADGNIFRSLSSRVLNTALFKMRFYRLTTGEMMSSSLPALSRGQAIIYVLEVTYLLCFCPGNIYFAYFLF